MSSMKAIIKNFNKFIEESEELNNINEGGLKAPHLTGDVRLNPATVTNAVKVYETVMNMWNEYLQSNGHQPITLIGPVGSTAYYKRDEPSAEYGDVDFLISLPVEVDDTMGHNDARKAENKTQREYEKLLKDFLTTTSGIDKLVHVEATVGSSPYLLIVRLPNGDHVQVDTIVTHPKYSDKKSQWMPGRWTPEHGIKGYTIGNLYMALGGYFNMAIGDRGVTARMMDGERVSSRKTSADLVTISTNIRTFLRDMAEEIAGGNVIENELLTKYPGVDPENVKIGDLALGIKGLALTLSDNGIIESSSDMLAGILDRYLSGLTRNVESKKKRGASDEAYAKLIKLNDRVYNIAKQAFGNGQDA